MAMESISALYTIFFTFFSCCRGVISVKKTHGKKIGSTGRKRKVKRKGGMKEYADFLRDHYLSKIDYTTYDHLR